MKPLFGTRSHNKKIYSVTFHRDDFANAYCTGYSEDVVKKYPDLPVVDFASVELDTVLKALSIPDKYYIPEAENDIWNRKALSLEEYLAKYEELGIKVVKAKDLN